MLRVGRAGVTVGGGRGVAVGVVGSSSSGVGVRTTGDCRPTGVAGVADGDGAVGASGVPTGERPAARVGVCAIAVWVAGLSVGVIVGETVWNGPALREGRGGSVGSAGGT